MDVLQSCGILQHADDHCTHCGCLWSSQDDSEFCLRCRSHFFFSIPPSLSPSPKRVRLTNQRQLTYCWCETCETFHWLAYSFPPSFISILSLSTLPIISSAMSSPAITTSRRSARVRFIPSDRRNDRSATAGRLVCFVPRGRHTAHSSTNPREFRAFSPRTLRPLSETVARFARPAQPNRRRQTRHRPEPRE